jgi:hypothetical protein
VRAACPPMPLFVFALLLSGGCDVFLQKYESDSGGRDGWAGSSDTGGTSEGSSGGGGQSGKNDTGTTGGDGQDGTSGTSGENGSADVGGQDGSADNDGMSAGEGGSGGSSGSEGTGGYIGSGGSGGSGGGGSEEVVTDSLTGLIWQESYVTGYTWQKAINYCDSLTYAGQTDWRLPSLYVLASLVKYEKFFPASDFPGMPSDSFWSSSSYVSLSSNAWYVDFNDGDVMWKNKIYNSNVRCVRGGPLVIGSFEPSVISGDRIVTDTATGLTWQGCSAGLSGESCDQGSEATYTWQEAVDYCEGLTWAGYSDWRLPEIRELISTVDYRKNDPAIDETAFPATPGGVWSSSSFVNDANCASCAWNIGFTSGGIGGTYKTNGTIAARCVRGGP